LTCCCCMLLLQLQSSAHLACKNGLLRCRQEGGPANCLVVSRDKALPSAIPCKVFVVLSNMYMGSM
jgi:hypothetical protein